LKLHGYLMRSLKTIEGEMACEREEKSGFLEEAEEGNKTDEQRDGS
jgi:hypothetical protein